MPTPPGIRVRSSTDERWIYNAKYWDSFNPGGYTLPSYLTFSRYEYMEDVVRPEYDAANRLKVKNVLHEKVLLSGVGPISNHKSMARDEVIRTENLFPGITVPQVKALIPLMDPGLVSQYCREAFTEFTTQFPEEIGLANFLFELRELDQLFPRLSGSVGKDLSSGFLADQFGIQPLIDDLQKLSGLVKAVHDRIEWLRKTAGKPTRLGYYRKIQLSAGSPTILSGTGGSTQLALVPGTVNVDFRAGGTLLQNLGDLDSWITALRGFLGTAGLTNPVKIVWNAIPFSFIADWFLDIGSRVDALNLQMATADWAVYNLSHSITSVWSGALHRYSTSPYDPGPPIKEKLATVTAKRYQRGAGLPSSPTELGWTGLTPKQLALALAMIAAN